MAPSASWSVLDLRKTRRRPPSSSLTSSTSRATSSLRRSAPAKPNSSSVRSRASARPSPSGSDHRRDDLRAGRSHLAGRHALAAADAGPHRSHPGVGRRGLEAGHLVGDADRGQPASDRRGLARLGQCREVQRHRRRRRRQRLDRRTLLGAPGPEVGEVATRRPARSTPPGSPGRSCGLAPRARSARRLRRVSTTATSSPRLVLFSHSPDPRSGFR